MSVSETLTLPAQPVGGGGFALFPLGGDGFSSPSSVYAGRAQLAGDVSGGTNQIRINMDDRYTQVVGYMRLSILSAVADADGRMEINVAQDELIRVNVTTINRVLSGLTASNTALWTPPPVALTRFGDEVPNFRVIIDNADGETLQFGLRVYNFNREARHTVPLHVLFGFLARTGGMIV